MTCSRGIWVQPELLAENRVPGESAEGKVRDPFFRGLGGFMMDAFDR
jgi:hypothetical protein